MRHLFPSDRVAGLFDADRGLTADEVEQRRRLYGSNDILGDRRSGWADIARDTARDPMVWLLVATAFLFAWLGDYIEASVLALALVPIAGMDAYLHRRTQATTEGLAGRLATQARVLRDGVAGDIPSAELVPGDLVIVNESESFPADGVLVAGVNLQAGPRWSATHLGPRVDSKAQSYWGQGWFAPLGQLQEAAHRAEPAAVGYPRTNPRLRGTLAAAR